MVMKGIDTEITLLREQFCTLHSFILSPGSANIYCWKIIRFRSETLNPLRKTVKA